MMQAYPRQVGQGLWVPVVALRLQGDWHVFQRPGDTPATNLKKVREDAEALAEGVMQAGLHAFLQDNRLAIVEVG